MHATQHQSIALPIPLIRIQVLLGIEVFPTSEWRFEHGCRSSCIPSHLSTSWDLVLGGGRSSGGGVLPLAEAYAIGYCFADVKEDALDIIVSEALLEAERPAVILLGGEPQTVVLALNSPQFPEQRCLGWFRLETMHEGLLSFSAVEERAVHVVVSGDADDLAAGYLCSGLQAWGEGCVIAKELWEPGRWSAAMVQVVNPISSQHSKEPIVPKTLSVNRRRAAILPMQRGAGVGVDSVLVHYVFRINVADGHVTVTPLANGMESLHRGSTQKVTQGIFCIRIIRLQRCFTQICDLHTLVWLSVLEGRNDGLIVGSPTLLFGGQSVTLARTPILGIAGVPFVLPPPSSLPCVLPAGCPILPFNAFSFLLNNSSDDCMTLEEASSDGRLVLSPIPAAQAHILLAAAWERENSSPLIDYIVIGHPFESQLVSESS